MTITHNTILNQSIVERINECPRIVSRQEADRLVKEWKPQYEEEMCIQVMYNPMLWGKWPLNQEELTEQWEHRFDWMKSLKLVFIDMSK